MSIYFRPTREEIDLKNLRHNLGEIKRLVGKQTRICAVVKADGYGMGAPTVARIALSQGASYLAVAVLDEALELREDGIDAPILILGVTPPKDFPRILEYNLTQTMPDLETAAILSEEAEKWQKKAKVHIKLDTGMGRLGFQATEASIPRIKKLFRLKGLDIEGIFTHLAKAYENDDEFTRKQFKRFMSVVEALERENFSIPIKHVANSPTTVRHPEMHLDMVRPGNIMYGLQPPLIGKDVIDVRPVMSVKSTVAFVKTLPQGSPISYGSTFITRRDSVIATLPIGYADGYTRLLSSKGSVIIRNQYAPILGVVCMDQCMVDVTDIPGVKAGDEVVVIGSMGDKTVSLEDLSAITGIVRPELMISFTKRVPRVYVDGNEIEVKSCLVKG